MSPSILTAVVLCALLVCRPMRGAELPEIDLQLDKIRDRTLLESGDNPAYYGLLELARRSSVEAMSQSAAQLVAQRQTVSKKYSHIAPGQFPVFADMLSEPEAYRGRPVVVRGHSQEIKQYAAEENPFGWKTLYECSLFTDNSQSHPLTVVFTEAPPGLPMGERTVDGLKFTGYFMKLRAYNARDGRTRLAPLVMAHGVTWAPPQKAAPWFSEFTQFALLAGFVSLAVGWLVIRWQQRPSHRNLPDTLDLNPLGEHP
ncbi:MAG: hypothetical protein DWH91_12825 [Planctomycetota bacterium]|nr:MAG: hypothetical protein DWH91_12825 [Planctomycetota bacterium]